jgi:hypothetical protein
MWEACEGALLPQVRVNGTYVRAMRHLPISGPTAVKQIRGALKPTKAMVWRRG